MLSSAGLTVLMLSFSTLASHKYRSHNPSSGNHKIPPFNEYQSYTFGPPPPTSMLIDMSYHLGRPSNYAPQHQPQPFAIQLMGQPIWPSLLTGDPTQATSTYLRRILPAIPVQTPTHQTPILPAVPLQKLVSTVSTATEATPQKKSSRRKLTDDERRRMCIEAATNPNMKQTQLGLRFGVERSTVSKILRHKDKYMNPPSKEGTSSPNKKSKTKFPDIERALINWAGKEDREGHAITDDKLKKQALLFSSTIGNSDNHSHLTSDAWLAEFMMKHRPGAGKKSKSSSKDFSHVIAADLSTASYTDDHLDQSPVSSSGLVSSPLLLEEDDLHQDVNKQGNDDFFNLGDQRVGCHTPLPVRSMTTFVAPQDLHVNPREMMKRSESVPNIRDASAIYITLMKPPPLPNSERSSPVFPGSPTQEQALGALQTLQLFFQSQPSNTLDMDDWTSIGNMMRKLKLLRCGDHAVPAAIVPLGILDNSQPIKKRKILGIST